MPIRSFGYWQWFKCLFLFHLFTFNCWASHLKTIFVLILGCTHSCVCVWVCVCVCVCEREREHLCTHSCVCESERDEMSEPSWAARCCCCCVRKRQCTFLTVCEWEGDEAERPPWDAVFFFLLRVCFHLCGDEARELSWVAHSFVSLCLWDRERERLWTLLFLRLSVFRFPIERGEIWSCCQGQIAVENCSTLVEFFWKNFFCLKCLF